jgi:hypothetical protein
MRLKGSEANFPAWIPFNFSVHVIFDVYYSQAIKLSKGFFDNFN